MVHRRYARVLELTSNPGLIDESPSGTGVWGILILQNFDRDFAVERQVAGAIDDPHAATTDLVEQVVTMRRAGHRSICISRLGIAR